MIEGSSFEDYLDKDDSLTYINVGIRNTVQRVVSDIIFHNQP